MAAVHLFNCNFCVPALEIYFYDISTAIFCTTVHSNIALYEKTLELNHRAFTWNFLKAFTLITCLRLFLSTSCNCKFHRSKIHPTCLFVACGCCNLSIFCLIYCIACGIIHFNKWFGVKVWTPISISPYLQPVGGLGRLR